MDPNIISLLNDINILYNRKVNIEKLIEMLNENNVLTIDMIKSKNIIDIEPFTKNDIIKLKEPEGEITYVDIPDDGNCYYSAIAQALCPEIEKQNENNEIKYLRIKVPNNNENDTRINKLIKELRNLVAENVTNETIKQYYKIACLYAHGNEEIKIKLETLYVPGKRALLTRSMEICNIKPDEIDFVVEETTFDFIYSDDITCNNPNLIENIKNTIKKNTADEDGLIYLDQEVDLPIILNHFNIVILDIHKIDTEDKYDKITFHKPNIINENTRFIIITAEGNHTNLIYKNNFAFNEIPPKFLNLINKRNDIKI